MKKQKYYKFDKEKSEKEINEIFELVRYENIKKMKKIDLPNFIKMIFEKAGKTDLNMTAIMKVYDEIKTGVIK